MDKRENKINDDSSLSRYTVTGMSCAACQARVEKAVSKVPGVDSCAVNLLTNSMGVRGSASENDVIKAVTDAGYGAKKFGGKGVDTERTGTASEPVSTKTGIYVQEEEALRDTATPKLKKRLIASIAFLLTLMYISMGHMMFGFPLPYVFDNMVFSATAEMLLTIVVMFINRDFFSSGFRALFHGAPNMDTLVALGSSVSFGYSLIELFIMITAMGNGDNSAVMRYGMNLYFESAAMIPTLITIGKMLEAMSKGKTTDALKGLMKLVPQTAILAAESGGSESEVPISDVKIGDIFVVYPGGSIPVDGVVLEGMTAVNESAITGESVPKDKSAGDDVTSGTINQMGYIRCCALRVGEDTTLSQIIRTVSDASSTKAPIARIADRVSGIFVPAVMMIATATFILWLIAGSDAGFAIARAITVLVISCPCALGLATPVAIMVGNGVGARNGILYKTSEALENAGRARTVLLDKTGTITSGNPEVTDVIPSEGVTEEELLGFADALESESEHPYAKAVLALTRQTEEKAASEKAGISDIRILPGNGLTGRLGAEHVYGGSLRYISSVTDVPVDITKKAEQLSADGKTPLLFSQGNKILGIIAVADAIREDSIEAVRELKNIGLHTVMLTGDNEITANAIGRQAGIDEIVAGVKPNEKADVVKRYGNGTIMVGDGINDAPALVSADTGMAIGAGTDIAMDAADVVLMKSRLIDAAAAIRLSRSTIRNIHENLFWAFIYNIICIPMAAGLYGFEMRPEYGAAAMSLSSVCVCLNALRLNLADIYDTKHNRAAKAAVVKTVDENKEDGKMTKTLKVEGMMCEHCEARVDKALMAVKGVESAKADHVTGTVKIEMSEDVSYDTLKKAVEDQDYKVNGIE